MKPHSWEISGSFGEEPPLGSSNEAPCCLGTVGLTFKPRGLGSISLAPLHL